MVNYHKQKSIKWNTVKSKVILDNYYCRVIQEEVLTSTGKVVPEYFLVSRRDVVIIVPVTKSGKFVLIREYKHGVGQQILMFPAGLVDTDKNARDTAIKELREETGYNTGRVHFLGTFYEYPSNDTHKVYVFLAKNLPEAPSGSISKDEETELLYLTQDKLKKMILKNELKLATAVCAYILAGEMI
ncbi:MAG: NUDIX hydrolase [Candidatus Curtissbacteria bacterium]|nr:NUDIX hydrolase [Candidatus Curtissbacteria bacterium]